MVLFLSIYLHYNTVYTHPTSSGNKHIPSGGSAGQILRWSSDGTAVWGSDNNTTYSTGTSSASGLTKLYGGTGSATDGTMTQSAITSALNGWNSFTQDINTEGALGNWLLVASGAKVQHRPASDFAQVGGQAS